MPKTLAEIEACKERQRQICEPIGTAPHFAPMSGICWEPSCRKQIYDHPNVDGSTLVTGCPWCFKTYCD